MYRIPVALTPPGGKTALALCENTLAGVGRYGITSEDFWRAVNNNCDVAKKTGRLVVGGGNETEENGQCDMHLAALAAGLALSLVKRVENKKVINYWAPFQDLFKRLKTAAKYIFDKKNKRFPQYKASLGEINQPVIMVPLPNHTRIGGALILIQACLRSMSPMLYYATVSSTFDSKCLRRHEWKQLAQFEAVMRRGMLHCFDCQGDRPEIAGEMVLALLELQADYEFDPVYEVVDIDSIKKWTADKPFEKLPRIKMTTDSTHDTIPTMSCASIELV